MGFFKPEDAGGEGGEGVLNTTLLEASTMEMEVPIDYDNDVLLDLEKTHTHYSRFNGRFLDDNLEINDIIPVLIPH